MPWQFQTTASGYIFHQLNKIIKIIKITINYYILQQANNSIRSVDN